MKKLNPKVVIKYVEQNIGSFHKKRLESLNSLKLSRVLKKKNPYLFKAKYILTAAELVKGITDAHISSNEETIFGEWLEGLAIHINKIVYNGGKSGISGIDLEFETEGIRYIVTIKSGPNWGNNNQIKQMISDFNIARRTLRTSNSKLNVIAVNGCCYGRDTKYEKKAGYFKYCGQKFWEFISGEPGLYIDIIKPLGHKAKEKNEYFLESYGKMLNRFTLEFTESFCKPDGGIDWEKLVRYNSSIEKPKELEKT
jgi:hypothetical protein